MPLDPVDEALADALRRALAGEAGSGELLTLAEIAQRTGLSEPVLEAVAREGLLTPRHDDETPRYAVADVDAVEAGIALLDAGLPLGELLDLARRTDESLRELADHAVETFLRFVRDPVRGTAPSTDAASDRLVTAFRAMLPATGALVGSHFRRLLLAAATSRLEQEAAPPAPDAPPPAGRSAP